MFIFIYLFYIWSNKVNYVQHMTINHVSKIYKHIISYSDL
jgi:hypothetical protein